jgi:hypothetical protein
VGVTENTPANGGAAMSQKDKDGALGAGEALDKSVREAAENDGRAKRESDAEHLTEATHGITTKDGDRATPPVGKS